MDTVRITGIKHLQKKVNKLKKTPFIRPMLGEIGMFSMHSIKKRTLSGEDVHGIAFKPYSKAYSLIRKKKGFPVRPVDLTRTGSMMSSMTYDVNRVSVDIFFMNTSDPSNVQNPKKAFFLQQEREFFALSKQDIQGIVQIVDNYYKRLINQV